MFKLQLKMAFLNIFRRKIRSISIIVMIGVSLFGLMSMQGLYEGMYSQMINNALRSDCGDVSIFAKNFRQERDLEFTISNAKEIEDFLLRNANVKSYIKRVIADGLVSTAKASKGVQFYGVEREKEALQGKFEEYIKKGEFDFGSREKGAVIGAELAKQLGVGVGKKIILTAKGKSEEIVSLKLKVSGIMRTNNISFDKFAVFMDIKKAREFLELTEEEVMQFSIMAKSDKQLEKLIQDLKESFEDKDIQQWQELYPALSQSEEIMKIFNFVSYTVVFVIASIGIFGVVLVSILERIKEFGIMLAVGNSFRDLALLILLESLIIGFLGFLLGAVLGGGSLLYLKIYGLDLTLYSDALELWGIDSVMKAIIKPDYFITAFFAVFSAVFASVLLPLRILKRQNPINSIKEI